MAVQARLYTTDDLWELSALPENADRHYELVEGELIEVAPSSFTPGSVASNLDFFIKLYCRQHDLGRTTTAEAGYELSPNNVLAPDVGFVSKARMTKEPDRYYMGAPDLAVEVVSPTDRVKVVQRKAAKYLAYGTHLVWIVYPQDKTVDICRPSEHGMSIEEIGIDDVLDGGDVLPGFTLSVKDIFEGIG